MTTKLEMWNLVKGVYKVCVCVCVCARVRACVHVWVGVRGSQRESHLSLLSTMTDVFRPN